MITIIINDDDDNDNDNNNENDNNNDDDADDNDDDDDDDDYDDDYWVSGLCDNTKNDCDSLLYLFIASRCAFDIHSTCWRQ